MKLFENSDKEKLKTLTDGELHTLIKYFNDLSIEEQEHLKSFLSTVEKEDPQRVSSILKNIKTNNKA